MSEASPDIGNRDIVLGLLTSIERDSAVTQRKLAGDLGIALGLANAYLRRCVRKGLVKMRQAPLNRYAYYLTPQGFAEKSRLTAEYLAVSLDFFRRARSDCMDLFQQCAAREWRMVALYGAGELAEIAVLSAGESGVGIVCVVDPEWAGRNCAGLAVVADLSAARRCAAPQLLDGHRADRHARPASELRAVIGQRRIGRDRGWPNCRATPARDLGFATRRGAVAGHDAHRITTLQNGPNVER